ncbi:MAG: biotin/lipoyl-binding protein [Proteobacteria bacterium]|nr:biotin/lipoyl-binding protein [Pseudomonadota bacterium]MBU4054963.1 biotin/lipoyl-binding protein [Pseudomonadota bacterium]
MIYKFNIEKENFEVDVASVEKDIALVYVNGTPYTVNIENLETAEPVISRPTTVPKAQVLSVAAPAIPKPTLPVGSGVITAQIPGLILQIKVSVGDAVKVGQVVAVMEAMKMENDIASQVAGTVKEIRVQKGSEVSTGDVLMIIG